MDVAGDAPSLASALNHSVFSMSPTQLAAWLGGVAISAGGWMPTSWVGLSYTLVGIGVLP